MNKEQIRLEEKAVAYKNSNGRLSARLISHYAFETVRRDIQGPAILLLGLGDGVVAQRLAHSFEGITAVEGSKSVIENSDTNGMEVIHSLFEEYEPEREFDTVLASYVLEHIIDPVSLIRRTKGWLGPGGQAIFIVPNADSLHRRVGVELGFLRRRDELNQQDVEVGHRRVYTLRTLSDHLYSGGFESFRFQGFLVKVVSNRQMADWSRELLDALYRISLRLPPQYCSSIAATCRGHQ